MRQHPLTLLLDVFRKHRYAHYNAKIVKIVFVILLFLIEVSLEASVALKKRDRAGDPELAGRGLSDDEKVFLEMGMNPNGNYCDKEQIFWWD